MMKEEIEELYQNYLSDKLDLVFEVEKINIEYDEYNQAILFNKKGEVIKVPINFIHDAQDNISLICSNNKYNFINKDGVLLRDTWFEDVGYFYDGFAGVKKNNLYNFINIKGELISKEWFDYAFHFYAGFAVVKKNNLCNFISTNGELVSKEWFDDAFDFCAGFAVVKKNNLYNFISTKGELISKEWFDDAFHFCAGFAAVKKDGLCNFINTNGELISKEWFDRVDSEHGDFAAVAKNGLLNFINIKGELISKEWFYVIKTFRNRFNLITFVLIKNKNKYNIINEKGEVLFNFTRKYEYKIVNQFIVYNNKVLCQIEMKDYEVKKQLFGYVCTNSIDIYKVKYQPIKKYGLRYTLCLDNYDVVLHDRLKNEYIFRCNINNFFYDDNFLFDNKNNLVYLIYENQMIEITEYYNKNLKDKSFIKLNSGVTRFITKEEFSLFNRDKIDEIFKQLKEERRLSFETKRKEEEENRLKEIQNKKEEIQKQKLEILNQIKDAVQTLSELSINDDSIPRLLIDDIFDKIDNYLVIKPKYLDLIKYIDLGYVTFDNVKMEGIDFSETNIYFNPQNIYQKNLRNCIFNTNSIRTFMDFTGVDIRGCIFNGQNPEFNVTLKNAIYDETTLYNGIPLIDLLKTNIKK